MLGWGTEEQCPRVQGSLSWKDEWTAQEEDQDMAHQRIAFVTATEEIQKRSESGQWRVAPSAK